MAVDFKCDFKRNSVYYFYPEEIVIKPENNGRLESPNVEAILRSFEQIGQISPCSVQVEGGRPVLVAGFTRWQAAKLFNEGKPEATRMRLACVVNKGSALDTTVMNIHENSARNPTTALDDAHNIARLQRFGKSEEEIAETYHQDVKWVKKRLKLLSLSEESRNALTNGAVKLTAAEKLASMTAEQQHAALTKPKQPKEKSKAPARKQILEAAQAIADSPGHSREVRAFAANWKRFLAGEISIGEL